MVENDQPVLPSFSPEEVAKHHTATDCWIIYENLVYDVTGFLESHPGGEDMVLMYGGKDVSEVLHDPSEHAHSDFAVQMLEDYLLGTLLCGPSSSGKKEGSPGLVADPKFMDITKPMFPQIWRNQFSKEYYLEQVHIARHVKDGSSAPIFGNFLEYGTLTPWYVIPLVWLPLVAYWLSVAATMFNWPVLTFCFAAGLVHWTFLEYAVHRFLFHVDEYLPDHPKAFVVHFLAHGVHHFLPMDKFRLVMPPALFTVLMIPVYKAYRLYVCRELCCAVGAGTVFGYVCYDLCHYFLHHGRSRFSYLREMKTYHLNHHYQNWELGFGITNKFWDQIFGTELLTTSKVKGN